jgi:hypothetical protein
MRPALALLVLAACSSSKQPAKSYDAAPRRAPDARPLDAEPAGLAPHRTAKDLPTAWRELIGDDVRAVGIGELHTRVDRQTKARSAIARFTDEILPVVATRASDLVVETWLIDKKCGKEAAKGTAKVQATVQRGEATLDEVSTMVTTARAAGIQPHAMLLGCKDWKAIFPKGVEGEPDLEPMLQIITRELGRIAATAVADRAKAKSERTLVMTYGGALHNDLYPQVGIEDFSFGPKVDQATGGHYVELELIVPEYAELDNTQGHEPWYPLLPLASPDHVVIVEKAPRSYAVLLPRTR